jgi:hypothetical protein
LHAKTDLFCSAGLQLPDKAGRQITIGGWSDIALAGIRFYTPDGSAGVNGTNDWQENNVEVHLQNPRWYALFGRLINTILMHCRYPSAAVLANGTIIVVGGEDGSNGKPVSTIEILPPSGAPIYMDWLAQSDPWNLYPFIAVTKAGVLIGYYNQARILDENTFATKYVRLVFSLIIRRANVVRSCLKFLVL